MTLTKELIQPTEAVTREVTAAIISPTKTPPYIRIRRLIRPAPRPTKPTMTKSRIRGLPVMAPTKEPIQETPPETREPISATIAAIEPTVGAVVRTPHFKKISQTDDFFNQPNCNKKESKANEIRDRLRKKKSGELLEKPSNKGLHISHAAKHLPSGRDRKSQEQEAQRNKPRHNRVALPANS